MSSTTLNPDEFTLRDKNLETNAITFMIEGKEVIKLTKDGFYYFGEHVKDPFEVYIRFHEYLKANNI
jgi:hypothetical protein